MDKSVIHIMHSYNDWANDRVLGTLGNVPESDLKRKLPGRTPILETFAHIVCGEWIWLERWKGRPPVELPPWTSGASLAILAEHLNETRAERNQLLEASESLELEAVVTYWNLTGDVSWNLRVGDMLLHVVNHSSYHRGQLASMLRQLGVTPPETDFLIYASQSP